MQRVDAPAAAARGRPLDLSEDAFGWLRPSDSLTGDPEALRARLEHAGTDSATRRLRLSTDGRYQRADADIDERWIAGANGEAPVGHGVGAKRGRIC